MESNHEEYDYAHYQRLIHNKTNIENPSLMGGFRTIPFRYKLLLPAASRRSVKLLIYSKILNRYSDFGIFLGKKRDLGPWTVR